jgi:ERCC4-type nuclease
MTTEDGKPIVVKTEKRALWVDGLADYTINGHERRIQIERKSISDLFGTLGQRRQKFEEEVARLHETCHYAAVIVEGSLRMVREWQGHGPVPKSVEGTIRAWSMRYSRVHWHLRPTRFDAERKAVELFDRYWKDFERGKLPA